MRLLHKCDLFREVQDKENHLTPATPHGAAVSIATAALLVILLLGEVYGYMSGHKNCHITPSTFKNTLDDAARKEVDVMRFSISLPFIPCDRIATETMTRYGHDAEVEQRSQVMLFHIPRGSYSEDTSTMYTVNELPRKEERGCHVTGFAPLSTSRASFNVIIKDYQVSDSQKYRPDFLINRLFMGIEYENWGVPQIRRQTLEPLSGFMGEFHMGVPYFFQFYMQLIQTTVDRPGKDDRFGYQYTAYNSMITYNGLGRAPGLYFSYQPSSFSMDCQVSYDTPSHFIVNLCAVAGGVYTVASIIEAGVEWLARRQRLREASEHNRLNAETLKSAPQASQ